MISATTGSAFCGYGTLVTRSNGSLACRDCSACYSSSAQSISSLTTSFASTSSVSSVSPALRSSSQTSEGGSAPPITCGNSRLDPGEQCDDGNVRNGDGCSKLCRLEAGRIPVCGNGLLEVGEQCDHGMQNGSFGEGCSTLCAFLSTVGNGILEPGEECDDGNLRNGDGCDMFGRLEPGATPFCGDAVLESGEECDHGVMNGLPGEGCTQECHILGIHGNGILEPGEECDDGNTIDGDGCDHNGMLEPGFFPRCGDSVLEIGEECDDGPLNSNAIPGACLTNCRLSSQCGDGILDRGEQCDRGALNAQSGSPCDASCRITGIVAAAPTESWLPTQVSPFSADLLQQQVLAQQQLLLQQQRLLGQHAGQDIPGRTGPAAIAVMAAGAASGIAWMRRKQKRGTSA